MAYDDGNIFARILRGEIPCVKVYEDAEVLSFMDIMPQTAGHVLVIPKYKAQDIFDLPANMAAALICQTQRIAGAVRRALDAPGILLAQLNGAAAGQTVFHIHFHIIPRAHGIDLKLHAREMAPVEELEAQAVKIRAALEEE